MRAASWRINPCMMECICQMQGLTLFNYFYCLKVYSGEPFSSILRTDCQRVKQTIPLSIAKDVISRSLTPTPEELKKWSHCSLVLKHGGFDGLLVDWCVYHVTNFCIYTLWLLQVNKIIIFCFSYLWKLSKFAVNENVHVVWFSFYFLKIHSSNFNEIY